MFQFLPSCAEDIHGAQNILMIIPNIYSSIIKHLPKTEPNFNITTALELVEKIFSHELHNPKENHPCLHALKASDHISFLDKTLEYFTAHQVHNLQVIYT